MGGLFSHLATNPKSQGGGGGGSRGVSKAATQSSAGGGGGEGGGGDVLDAEQEQRSDPAYLVYYYNNINLNPRLPPPIISWENYRLAQRLQSGMGGVVGGGIGDKRKLRSMDDSSSNSRSLFSTQPVLPTHREEPEHVEEDNNNSSSPIGNLVRQSSSTTTTNSWADRRVDRLMMGLSSTGIGARPKSLVDLIQVGSCACAPTFSCCFFSSAVFFLQILLLPSLTAIFSPSSPHSKVVPWGSSTCPEFANVSKNCTVAKFSPPS
jgi:hypothetical protein